MKNVSKNKCSLLCFRPVVDMDAMLESRGVVVRNRRLRYLGVEENDGIKNSEILDNGCNKKYQDLGIHQNQPPKRTLSRLLKAVVFGTILNKRVRDKEHYCQDSYGSKRSSYSTNTQRSSRETNIEEIKPGLPLSSSSSFRSTSSLNFSSSALEPNRSSRSISDKEKQNEDNHQDPDVKQRNKDRGVSGMYLLLISLAITVLLGKIFGIFFTSIWMYFFHCRNTRLSYYRQENRAKFSITESRRYYNKRVIMEGLLDTEPP
ncbi:putative Transmembrane protein [Quillaja saponaria]|uniref:Transmembrane protein n=1 Tax=Quillaja saponaria TaxID=32244 RepID=A0AAD7QHB2_QUISA|nr:putative Transmembrane protein [Quillaja saponaria]